MVTNAAKSVLPYFNFTGFLGISDLLNTNRVKNCYNADNFPWSHQPLLVCSSFEDSYGWKTIRINSICQFAIKIKLFLLSFIF